MSTPTSNNGAPMGPVRKGTKPRRTRSGLEPDRDDPLHLWNQELLAVAERERFFTDIYAAPEYHIRCYRENDVEGFWMKVGPDRWWFYLYGRNWITGDRKALKRVVPGVEIEPCDERRAPYETIVIVNEADAVALMTRGPRWIQARRKRILSPEERQRRTERGARLGASRSARPNKSSGRLPGARKADAPSTGPETPPGAFQALSGGPDR